MVVGGVGGKRFEEVGGSARGCRLEPLVPGLEEGAQVVAKFRELDQADLGGGELFRGEGPDLPAGRSALLPFPEHQGEFSQGEPEGQGPPDQQDAGEGRLGIDPVVVLRSGGPGEDAHALVVPQGVGADPGAAREFPGSDSHGSRIIDPGTHSRVKENLRDF